MDRLSQFRLTIPALLGFAVLCVYLASGASDLLNNGDSLLRYQTTQALVDHGRLWLDQPAYTDTRIAPGIGGHMYAFYGPGQELLMAPLYVLGKVAAHHFNLPYDVTTRYATHSLDLILGALLAAVFCWFAICLGFSRRVAVAFTLVLAFATVAWPDAQSGLEQTQVNLLLLLATLCFWYYRRERPAGLRWLVLCACSLGGAILTRYDAAIYAGVFLIATLWPWVARRQWRDATRPVSIFIAALLPWIGAIALWNQLRFGSPFQTGLHEDTFGGSFFGNLLALLVSPGKGILWYLPLIVLVPWGARYFARRDPGLAALFGALVAVPLVFYASIQYWHGDPSWGPRYLYTAIPYLIFPIGELFVRWSRYRPPIRTLIAGVIALSLVVQVAALSVTQWRFWYHLEATAQQSVDESRWLGQPFRWGAAHYHYYWTVSQSPVLMQFRDVSEVLAVSAGDSRYRLTGKPDPFIGADTSQVYPVNSLNFWWADTMHPLLGPHTREGLALLLGLMAGLSLLLLGRLLRGPPAQPLTGTLLGRNRPATAGVGDDLTA